MYLWVRQNKNEVIELAKNSRSIEINVHRICRTKQLQKFDGVKLSNILEPEKTKSSNLKIEMLYNALHEIK